jgi:molybdenum cofactor cytidylyltransferase
MAPLPLTVVLLAAGPSSRLGTPKQLLLFRGLPLIRHLALEACASQATRIVIVLGSQSDTIRPLLHDLRVEVVINEQWNEGMASSLRAGVEAATRDASAVLLLVCDQPFVTTGLIDKYIHLHRTDPNTLIAAAYSGTIGVPALFPKRWMAELLQLHGDRGAKTILETYRNELATIPFEDGAIDIDTVDDLKKLIRKERHT